MARSGYIYVVGLNYSKQEWFFTVKHEALRAISKSGYKPELVTLYRVPGYSWNLGGYEAFHYDVEKELRDSGYLTEPKGAK